MVFGERLKTLREDKGIYQKELAFDLNVTSQTISYWEIGRCFPDFQTLVKIANYFNVSTDFLLGNEKKAIENFQIAEEQDIIKRYLLRIGFLNENDDFTDKDFLIISEFLKANKKFIKNKK